MAIHKRHEEEISNKKQVTSDRKEQPVVVSDIVTETTERIEVIEEASLDEPKSEPAVESARTEDLLSGFKEKMSQEEQVSSFTPAKKNFMWPILFVVFLALAMLTGIFVYKKGMINDKKVNVVTLSPTPTLTPKPTKTVDLTKYEIEILNGSGVDGEAGRQRDFLKAEGFTIAAVGNADNSDYTETIIQAKEEVDKDFITKLKNVLEDTFIVGKIEILSEDASTPIVVILGTKK